MKDIYDFFRVDFGDNLIADFISDFVFNFEKTTLFLLRYANFSSIIFVKLSNFY